jgi:pimeloyl-ACP methyl ester carboxylesterase
MTAAADAAPPSPLLLLLEGRALAEYGALLLAWPLLGRLPRGDGHAVLVLPGFGASDASTEPLRRALRRLGYAAHGWELGRNLGMRRSLRAALDARVEQLHREHGRLSLVGWSLGGVYARELARDAPGRVRRVITLGSPFNHHPRANNADRVYRWLNGGDTGIDWEGFHRRRVPPPVPCTAIYSKSDGVVHWRCSMEDPAPNTENVEVGGSHLGLGVNVQVLRVIAERLARPVAP